MATKRKVAHDALPDREIAKAIRHAMKLDNDVPEERIRVSVRDGFATIVGSVERNVQKEAAQDDANRVKGVRGVVNRIEVMPERFNTTVR